MRNGWGENPRSSRFGMKNFCGYYLFFSQIYSIFLFNAFSKSFKAELNLAELDWRSPAPGWTVSAYQWHWSSPQTRHIQRHPR